MGRLGAPQGAFVRPAPASVWQQGRRIKTFAVRHQVKPRPLAGGTALPFQPPGNRHHGTRHGGDKRGFAVARTGASLTVGNNDGPSRPGDGTSEQEAFALAWSQRLILNSMVRAEALAGVNGQAA